MVRQGGVVRCGGVPWPMARERAVEVHKHMQLFTVHSTSITHTGLVPYRTKILRNGFNS